MSGEFGEYDGGYFHDRINICVEDLQDAELESSRLWGVALEAFAPVARSISWAEAGDSSEERILHSSMEARDYYRAESERIARKYARLTSTVQHARAIGPWLR